MSLFSVCAPVSPSLLPVPPLLGSDSNSVLSFTVTTLTHQFKTKIFVLLQIIGWKASIPENATPYIQKK